MKEMDLRLPIARVSSEFDSLNEAQKYAVLCIGLDFIAAAGRISGRCGTGISLGPHHWELIVRCADAISETKPYEMVDSLARLVTSFRKEHQK